MTKLLRWKKASAIVNPKRFSLSAIYWLVPLLITPIFLGSAFAQHELVLHSFSDSEGFFPYSGLVSDNAGNLYGTTLNGGPGAGTIYMLSPPGTSGTGWTESVIYRFGGSDGSSPYGTLTIDNAGNLYGTADAGGSANCLGGCGLVYELSPPVAPGENWEQNVLYMFGGGSDGFSPEGGVVLNHSGNLLGTTEHGGLYDAGTVFDLSRPTLPGGSWTKTSLWDFTGGKDGSTPGVESLVSDGLGHIFSTTYFGGDFGGGTVFVLAQTSGVWNETVLHSFGQDTDGANPTAGLVRTKSGALAGTTQMGGPEGLGTAFALTPPSQQGGEWIYTVLHYFGSFEGDGWTPQGPLTVGNRGLYGTTLQGGLSDPLGTIYELMPVNGNWVERILYDCVPTSSNPYSGVLIHNGSLFGTFGAGGVNGEGAVYQLILSTVPESPQ